MWSPPMWTDRSGLRAWMSNSRGALATCSRMKSGSSLTLLPSTFCPALRNSSSDSVEQELDAQLGHDPPPSAVERLHRVLAEDLVARHLVDEHRLRSPRSKSWAASGLDRAAAACVTYTTVEQEFQHVDRQEAPQGTQAIDRAAQLLTLVLDSDEPIGVGDLADAADLPKSTASRLVSSLERHGLVRRTGDARQGRGRPGDPALRPSRRRRAQPRRARPAPARARSASAAARRSTSPCPRHGGVEHLAQVDSVHFLGTGQWVGRTRRLPHDRGRQGPRRLRRSRAPPGRLRRTAAATIVDRAALEAEFARVRERGVRDGDRRARGRADRHRRARPRAGRRRDRLAGDLRADAPPARERVAELKPVLTKEAAALSARLGPQRQGKESGMTHEEILQGPLRRHARRQRARR